MPIPVILDCDPGHDDAMAILLAVADPAIDLRAVATVAGNQTVEKTALNARRMLSLAGVTDVPVAMRLRPPARGAAGDRRLRARGERPGRSGVRGAERPARPPPRCGPHPRHAGGHAASR